MYAPFFGLTQPPFSISPDPRYLFMSERHQEALAHLLYGLGAGGGFVLLTGEIGAGKTTVCHRFLEQIPAHCNTAYIFNPKLTVTELLQSVCEEFGLAPVGQNPSHHPGPLSVKDYIDPLNKFLLQSHAAGQNNILIIDEAQNLSEDVLEQLRLLTNLETSERKLLQIILIGQPGLRRMLARPELEQLAQRIIARFHLDALTEDETARYISHRLRVAGRQDTNPFTAKARQRIHSHTAGVPRRINLLCDRAMLGAYAASATTIDEHTVDKAASEVFDMAAPLVGRPQAKSAIKSFALGFPMLLGITLAVGLAASALLLSPSIHPQPPALATSPAVTRPLALVPSPATVSTAPPTAVITASALPQAPPPIRLTATNLSTYFPRPVRDVTYAWRALATGWQIPAADGDPCTLALRSQVQCFRIKDISLPLIQQLNRPGILTLQGENGKLQYAVLTALTAQSATLQMGDTTQTIAIASLANVWQGDFATYWRAPPDYLQKISEGQTHFKNDWLAIKLAAINGDPKPAPNAAQDATLILKIRGFQLAHGLKPDGIVGATTFMQINRVTGVEEPRLHTNASR
jgi:general secretion pathway protein A